MIIRPTLFCLGTAALLVACATTLDRSGADRLMRLEGSYTCDSFSLEPSGKKETLAQADTSRIRCARDSWAVQGGEVHFTRSLYHTRNCEVPLGRIQYKSAFERGPHGLSVHGMAECEVVRTNIGWMGERSGKCLLTRLKVNQPYPLRDKYCHAYIPDICKSTRTRIELTAPESELDDEHREPVTRLMVEGGECKRYAAD